MDIHEIPANAGVFAVTAVHRAYTGRTPPVVPGARPMRSKRPRHGGRGLGPGPVGGEREAGDRSRRNP
ncbi:hypothetical protein PY32053_02909 [Paracoccus yeei]|uniref:Uncharacterized protein n=1 Tax=Paracoccus yeei TaxID=147645 RepID=A0A386UPE6_9RHOB|nr:hypothetical protein PY32053_02909 [Paracoccus yeei]